MVSVLLGLVRSSFNMIRFSIRAIVEGIDSDTRIEVNHSTKKACSVLWNYIIMISSFVMANIATIDYTCT